MTPKGCGLAQEDRPGQYHEHRLSQLRRTWAYAMLSRFISGCICSSPSERFASKTSPEHQDLNFS